MLSGTSAMVRRAGSQKHKSGKWVENGPVIPGHCPWHCTEMKTPGPCPLRDRGWEHHAGLITLRPLLQELPEKWNNIKKLAVTVRQHVAPLQASEVALLRQRCTAFEAEQQQFWEQFHREAPFRYGPRLPPPLSFTCSHLLVTEGLSPGFVSSLGMWTLVICRPSHLGPSVRTWR